MFIDLKFSRGALLSRFKNYEGNCHPVLETDVEG